jgi:hypothetical protein
MYERRHRVKPIEVEALSHRSQPIPSSEYCFYCGVKKSTHNIEIPMKKTLRSEGGGSSALQTYRTIRLTIPVCYSCKKAEKFRLTFTVISSLILGFILIKPYFIPLFKKIHILMPFVLIFGFCLLLFPMIIICRIISKKIFLWNNTYKDYPLYKNLRKEGYLCDDLFYLF